MGLCNQGSKWKKLETLLLVWYFPILCFPPNRLVILEGNRGWCVEGILCPRSSQALLLWIPSKLQLSEDLNPLRLNLNHSWTTHGRLKCQRIFSAKRKNPMVKRRVANGNFEVQEVVVVHGGWCGPEVGSFISLFTMGLVHSYQGFSKRMYETIIQLWLFLILSKTNPKKAFFWVWGLGWKLLWCHDTCSSPGWPKAQPFFTDTLDGGEVFLVQRFPKIPWPSFQKWNCCKFISWWNIELWENMMILVHLYLGKMARHQSSKVWCSHGTTRRASPPEVLWLLIGFDHDPMATPMLWPKRVVIWNFEFEHSNMRDPRDPKHDVEGPTSKRRDWLLDTNSLFNPVFSFLDLGLMKIPVPGSSDQNHQWNWWRWYPPPHRPDSSAAKMAWGHGINVKTHFPMYDIWIFECIWYMTYY